jgi:hypothetical protein
MSAPIDGEHELFGFLTADPNAVVAPIHPKAMPVILTNPDEVDLWLAASAEFTAMRRLAMRFRGLFGWNGGGVGRLDDRCARVRDMQRFARTIRQDREAVCNAMSEPWSNGQTEGQINRLKILKRAMYGRAGVELLRARMMPL